MNVYFSPADEYEACGDNEIILFKTNSNIYDSPSSQIYMIRQPDVRIEQKTLPDIGGLMPQAFYQPPSSLTTVSIIQFSVPS